jgi:hypothetical protein
MPRCLRFLSKRALGPAPRCARQVFAIHYLRNTLGSIAFSVLALLTVTAWAQTQPPFQKHALLIGINKYPGLSENDQLGGSHNDVAAMRQLLIERFEFPEQNIVSLLDEQATSLGIREALQSLALRVRESSAGTIPAQVVVHFSGHGSQIADQNAGLDHDEDDGLDETWVPFDASLQGGAEDIRDDELNALSHKICEHQATRLLFVFDCCHSGTGCRGATKVRQLKRQIDVSPQANTAPIVRKRLPAGAVVLSACRALEVEPEYVDGGKTYGLLTRFLVHTLSEQRVLSSLTYEMLQQAILTGYQRERLLQAPTPQLEGASTSGSNFLGFESDLDRPPYFVVEKSSGNQPALLRAGSFHGVTPGSLFEIFERPGQIASANEANSPSVAWLRIVDVDAATSTAEAIQWIDDQRTEYRPAILPADFKTGFAILRHEDPPPNSLRISVLRTDTDNAEESFLKPNDPSIPAKIAHMLGQIAKPGESQWLQWNDDPKLQSDLLLRIEGDYAALFPSTGVAQIADDADAPTGQVPASLRGGWGPLDVHSGMDNNMPPQSLTSYLRRISRVRNLVGLGQSDSQIAAANYDVKLDLLKVNTFDSDGRPLSSEPHQPNADDILEMKEDDIYSYQITNLQADGNPIFITLLEISPNMGIQVMVPDPQGDPNVKLEAGESYQSNAYACGPQDEAQPFTAGTFYAVMLVTREPADFRFVANQELPQTRAMHSNDSAGDLVDRLSQSLFFRKPSTRGRPVRQSKSDNTWAVKVMTWKATR